MNAGKWQPYPSIILLQVNQCVEECVTTRLGCPNIWVDKLRAKWEMRKYLSLEEICKPIDGFDF